MKNSSRNPLSGRNSSGFRFKFHVRSISSHPLYLPIEMKHLPQIQQLIQGVAPSVVFNCFSNDYARSDFRHLRLYYDFDYWAATEYLIRDINDVDNIVPLILNDAQFHVIDILRKRYFLRKIGRYVISKSIRRCGLSTCIHAFLLWMQIYRHRNNSYTCGPSEISMLPLKNNLCRYLHRDVVPPEMGVFIPMAGGRAFFNSFRSPDAIRGINLGYVHFQDMSRFKDRDAKRIARAFSASVSAVLIDYFTFVVLEGDLPTKNTLNLKMYIREYQSDNHEVRMQGLSRKLSNPFFVNEVMVARSYPDPHFFYIHLNSSFSHSAPTPS